MNQNQPLIHTMLCKSRCTSIDGHEFCLRACSPQILPVLSPPPPSLPSPSHRGLPGTALFAVTMVTTGSIIIGLFLFCILCKKLKEFCYSRREATGTRNTPTENFPGDDGVPAVDHHVWYINTIGLPQSVIDSIAMFKFNKVDKLIDGTECSVCLSEFEEDQSLRLLPKCSHAFHVPCIDAWLGSHQTCPLCRAPIVSNPVERFSGESTWMEENGSFLVSDEVGEDESSEISMEGFSRNSSDLIENHVAEEEVEPMRRSVSVDSLSASGIYQGVNSMHVKNTVYGNVPKRSSFERTMERFSSSGKNLFSSRHCRSQSSVLPL